MPLISRTVRLLKSPWLALTSIILGGYVGLYHQQLAKRVAPIGDIYLALLEMFILPIVVTALIHTIGQLLMGGMCARTIRRILVIFFLGMLAAALTAILLGATFSPGTALAEEGKAVLGESIIQYELGDDEAFSSKGQSLLGFMQIMIPGNIIKAASVGNSLALVFFCIITGIALGSLNNDKARMALTVLEAGYDAFMKIITWVMYALPIGLFCLVASKLTALGADVVTAMGTFVAVFYGGSAVLLFGYLLLSAWRGKVGLWRAARAVKEPLIVALGTSSNLATIPSTLRALALGLRHESDNASLVIPLGMNINLQGSVFYFTLAALFTAQLYGKPLAPEEYLLLAIAGIFTAIAASDVPGIAAIGMISIMLEPIGVPIGITIILLSVIDPLIDPVTTLTDVYGNYTAAVLISGKES